MAFTKKNPQRIVEQLEFDAICIAKEAEDAAEKWRLRVWTAGALAHEALKLAHNEANRAQRSAEAYRRLIDAACETAKKASAALTQRNVK
jgi:hypothetical protein